MRIGSPGISLITSLSGPVEEETMLRKALTCDVLQTPFIVASVVNQLVENLVFTYVALQ
jgi:hypothetical protein